MKQLFKIFGILFSSLLILLVPSALAAETIVNKLAPDVTEEQAVAILTCQAKFPNGVEPVRIHFKEYTPQYKQWLLDNNLSIYQTRASINRHVGLGGRAPKRVVLDVQATILVESTPNAIGYSYGPTGNTKSTK